MSKTITKTVKARFTQGRIVPAENLYLREGDELEVTATVAQPHTQVEPAFPTNATAGAWSGQLDCEIFESEVYEGRLASNRSAVTL